MRFYFLHHVFVRDTPAIGVLQRPHAFAARVLAAAQANVTHEKRITDVRGEGGASAEAFQQFVLQPYQRAVDLGTNDSKLQPHQSDLGGSVCAIQREREPSSFAKTEASLDTLATAIRQAECGVSFSLALKRIAKLFVGLSEQRFALRTRYVAQRGDREGAPLAEILVAFSVDEFVRQGQFDTLTAAVAWL